MYSLDTAVAPGLSVSHAMHLMASPLLVTMHVSQSQLPASFWNMLARLGRFDAGAFVCKISQFEGK